MQINLIDFDLLFPSPEAFPLVKEKGKERKGRRWGGA